MLEIRWSNSEKKIAREAFDRAQKREYAALHAMLRERMERLKEPSDIWRLHDYLSKRRREFDDKYDFRYSRLMSVFGQLLAEGWLEGSDLEGLSEDKVARILMLGAPFDPVPENQSG